VCVSIDERINLMSMLCAGYSMQGYPGYAVPGYGGGVPAQVALL
jgi:hypothetical protein